MALYLFKRKEEKKVGKRFGWGLCFFLLPYHLPYVWGECFLKKEKLRFGDIFVGLRKYTHTHIFFYSTTVLLSQSRQSIKSLKKRKGKEETCACSTANLQFASPLWSQSHTCCIAAVFTICFAFSLQILVDIIIIITVLYMVFCRKERVLYCTVRDNTWTEMLKETFASLAEFSYCLHYFFPS